MHMAMSYDGWLSENTLYCNRQHARIAPAHCMELRQRDLDSRCGGCAGLETSARELEHKEPVVVLEDDLGDVMTCALATALQEIIQDVPDDDPEDLVCVVDDQLSATQLRLLELFTEEDHEAPVARRPNSEGRKRFAVFVGRCPRCRGYMVNSPERGGEVFDDDAHRCFACGYRTSPGYAWNRNQAP